MYLHPRYRQEHEHWSRESQWSYWCRKCLKIDMALHDIGAMERSVKRPRSSWWLQMTWCQIGTRSSAAIIMTSWWLHDNMNICIKQYAYHVTLHKQTTRSATHSLLHYWWDSLLNTAAPWIVTNGHMLQFWSINLYMGQVTKLRLSCYLVLLSVDSKTR